MGKLTGGSKLRKRRKAVTSNQRIISWARKRKHLAQNACVPQRIPLSCPLVGCNGTGHVNGIDLSHVTLCGCPSYHNVTFEKWAEMRAREEGLVSPVQIYPRNTTPVSSPAKLAKMHPAERAHQFWTSRTEPSLEGLASPMEVYQFRCAQQRLMYDKVSASEVLQFFRLRPSLLYMIGSISMHCKFGMLILGQNSCE
ncbi:unnamed protein product [Echinostoma caproni]|uniref:Uncharacterized protein n=1 Tax=Echinostoma caproni TaxID=27848 RepID=A0A183A1H5_9TREM|nr:unnamed protein product [Echinostoma caproni]